MYIMKGSSSEDHLSVCICRLFENTVNLESCLFVKGTPPSPPLLYPAVGFLLANAVVSGSPTSQSRRGNRPTIMDVRTVPIYCAI